jgi:hypothetical protein
MIREAIEFHIDGLKQDGLRRNFEIQPRASAAADHER